MMFRCIQYSEWVTENFLGVIYQSTQYLKSVLLSLDTLLSEIFGYYKLHSSTKIYEIAMLYMNWEFDNCKL